MKPVLFAVALILCIGFLNSVDAAAAVGAERLPSNQAAAAVSSAGLTFGLDRWMEATMPILSNLSLLDISLPGTHDTMTWDLSTTVSDNANDMSKDIAWIFHDFRDAAGIGEFIQSQAQSQNLNVTEQLDAGIRFFDFRVTYTAGPNGSSTAPHDWYCLHMVESNRKAMFYLGEAYRWLQSHSSEILVIWISHHGNECSTNFETDPAHQRAFFNEVLTLFGSMIFQGQMVNETTIGDMVASGQRVVLYVSEYHNMTGGSTAAINGCQIDNQLGDSSSNPAHAREFLLKTFLDADRRRKEDKARNHLYLLSMAGGGPVAQIESRLWLKYIPFDQKQVAEKCAADFHNPNMTEWCPETLRACNQLANYYNQYPLDQVIYNESLGLPGAIYINVVGKNGTIRTGVVVDGPADHEFAYVATVVLFNVLKPGGCLSHHKKLGFDRNSHCDSVIPSLEWYRGQHPLQLWSDPYYGRHVHWPHPPS